MKHSLQTRVHRHLPTAGVTRTMQRIGPELVLQRRDEAVRVVHLRRLQGKREPVRESGRLRGEVQARRLFSSHVSHVLQAWLPNRQRRVSHMQMCGTLQGELHNTQQVNDR